MTDTSAITRTEGELRGPLRRPVNQAAHQRGSIHDDATAQKLGFRGGTVAGSVHLSQFPPLLIEAFGREWFETGSLSLTFRNATVSDEPVVAFVSEPVRSTDAQVEVRMEREDGLRVADGTASIGDAGEPTHLHSIDLRASDPSELRILKEVRAGDPTTSYEEALDSTAMIARQQDGGLTEPLPWYSSASPWGGPIATPSAMVQLLYRQAVRAFGQKTGGAVGLFGAIEVRHHAGPVFLDQTYSVTGSVAAVGASPKTEYVWFDTSAADADGKRVASMRMQLRWMKASSPQYKSSL